ncbi:DUF1707 SHOCT-like domain-containing protein [Propionibacterium sp.]|uniref:DUF1707 SHOCT-like domain-containing protein n=1 Tax=Propionibacterium sp. TaxID=1977903 RepID=UPI0039EB05CE
MSGLPIESSYSREPSRPISDAERDEFTTRLNSAYERGDIPVETYQQTMDSLYAARTVGELVPLTAVLPARYRTTDPAGSGSEVELKPGEVNVPVTRPDTHSKLVRLVLGSAAAIVVIVILLVIFGVIF